LTKVLAKLKDGLPPEPGKATASQPAIEAPAGPAPATEPEQEKRTELAPAAPAAPQSAVQPVPAAYKVMPGQSLWSIADDVLGNGNRYREILDLNPTLRGDPARLVPGQELVVPASAD
jgi:nucleoid-associated protein YgaU